MSGPVCHVCKQDHELRDSHVVCEVCYVNPRKIEKLLELVRDDQLTRTLIIEWIEQYLEPFFDRRDRLENAAREARMAAYVKRHPPQPKRLGLVR